MFGAPSAMLVVGISIDWYLGDFSAGMSGISFSLDRGSGEVGDAENVSLSHEILEGYFLWKAQGVG